MGGLSGQSLGIIRFRLLASLTFLVAESHLASKSCGVADLCVFDYPRHMVQV